MARISFIDVAGVTKVVIDGRLDTVSVNAVESQFQAGVASTGSSTIVDLSNVSFIASLGIRMVLSAARSLQNRGNKFALFGASPAVMEIIESTALSDIIPVLRSEPEALARVQA